MKTVLINSCNFGSTGNIMLEIAETAENGGYTAAVCYPDKAVTTAENKRKRILLSGLGSRVIYTCAACRDNGT